MPSIAINVAMTILPSAHPPLKKSLAAPIAQALNRRLLPHRQRTLTEEILQRLKYLRDHSAKLYVVPPHDPEKSQNHAAHPDQQQGFVLTQYLHD
jgi:hypothetical protein